MKPEKYWQKRAEQVAAAQHDKADKYVEDLFREYNNAINSIQRDIEVFYHRFAVNNEISFSEARKILTNSELDEFRISLEDFISKAKDNVDGQWTKTLNNAYYKSRISRFEALQIQIRQQIEMLTYNQNSNMEDLLSDVYSNTYYQTIFEVQNGLEFAITFAKVDEKAVKRIINKPWIDSNFSSRIWNNKEKLLRELETNLSQAFIRGDSIDRTAQTISNRMYVSYSNAARLVRTETAHIVGEATFDGYRGSGVVKSYQFLATLDSRTSHICQSMDGKVFKLSEKEEGVNYPPLHVNCRSTTVAYFGDEEISARIARDDKGTYEVPSNMTYQQWKRKYVDSR
ncbi:minor capsid protein [Bacillus sp. FJAT-49736]|uniref:minor capsid protein n=1 Tax=Bacillus sp. FJAT-49736 TaxID=2833582 RepID=UPI001BCA16FD|nr:minor capsid protein [Bacillus sp. FJAT-49736]MBS4172113.1 minor capsid protein [Bacillus sp. FJAT-49736]